MAVDAEVVELDALRLEPGDCEQAAIHVHGLADRVLIGGIKFDAVGDAELEVGIFGADLFVQTRGR